MHVIAPSGNPTDQPQGHEFTGTIEEIGSEVKNFKKGDQIVSPFTVSWFVDLR